MTEESDLRRKHSYYSLSIYLTIISGLILIGGLLFTFVLLPDSYGPKQPIPFSHRVHAGDKKIGCLVCHPEAAMTYTGGIPPVDRCLHCHSRIIPTFAPIQDLKKHYYNKIPLEWKKINTLPEFVYFPHTMHVNHSIDCSRCHGDVKSMDRIVSAQKMNMGFCVQCHRKYNVPVDCFTCHR